MCDSEPRPRRYIGRVNLTDVVMKTNLKTKAARLQRNQRQSPYSAVACLFLLLLAGILVKFAALGPIFHVA
jgi:hypothetical protein